MAKGGTRIGGKPKGFKAPATISKELAREVLRNRVIAELAPLIDAQVANAKGISHFFLRDKAGQFVKIEDAKAIQTALNSGDEGSYYYIFTKDPSIQAFTDLMNRALDKPAEPEQKHEVTGGLVISWERPHA